VKNSTDFLRLTTGRFTKIEFSIPTV